jgi:hypothetical protein
VFYAYPKSWGEVNIYAGGFLQGWNEDSVSVTNAYSDNRMYKVYTNINVTSGTVALSAVAK